MKKDKYIIEIEIFDYDVDEGYFSFKYNAKVNGGKIKKGFYESDYENGNTLNEQKEELINGQALSLILENDFEELTLK